MLISSILLFLSSIQKQVSYEKNKLKITTLQKSYMNVAAFMNVKKKETKNMNNVVNYCHNQTFC